MDLRRNTKVGDRGLTLSIEIYGLSDRQRGKVGADFWDWARQTAAELPKPDPEEKLKGYLLKTNQHLRVKYFDYLFNRCMAYDLRLVLSEGDRKLATADSNGRFEWC